MSEYNCSECLAIVVKFSYNYDNSNIKKENNMSVNESQIKNTTAGAIDDDDAVIFKERKRLLFLVCRGLLQNIPSHRPLSL